MQAALAQRAEVLAALSRIDDGSYGRCVDCAGPVPEPRLEARPATARCVPCQSKRDRRRRLWGRSSHGTVSPGLNLSRRAGGAAAFRGAPRRGATGGRRPPVPGGAGGSSPRV
ncbi:MAG TPA: TraR/DksA family transcriptional regulator [Trebonia sp.]